jgi:two-component system, cell cycle response regulator
MPNAHILVADDDPGMLGTLAWILKEQGYDVASTDQGSRVISLMTERTPDLVLLDVLFGGDSSGTDVLEQIKQDERFRDIPVVMMSALTVEETAVRTFGLGAADYVRKPFRVRELLARIQAQLRMRAILRSAHDTVRETREALTRVQEQADQRRHLMDILHDVTDELSTGEIYHLLARRVAHALGLSQCSVVLTHQGGPPRVAAYAFETGISNFVLSMDKYPELQTALDTGRPVLVENVMVSPLYRHVRESWARDGIRISTRSVIAIPFAMQANEAGVFFLRRNVTEPPLTTADVEFAEAVIRAAVSAIQRATLIESTIADNRRLEELAHTDPLTKALNRRALGERLAAEMERVRRYSTTMSLLLIDLDHFKQVNDTHGHLAGDDVLIEVAALLQRVVRAVDIVARYGGEEFVVVLPETGAAGAEAFAERLRELIEEQCFVASRGNPIRLTTSIGVSSFPSFGVESVEDLLANADQALYRAKADGRNRVRV